MLPPPGGGGQFWEAAWFLCATSGAQLTYIRAAGWFIHDWRAEGGGLGAGEGPLTFGSNGHGRRGAIGGPRKKRGALRRPLHFRLKQKGALRGGASCWLPPRVSAPEIRIVPVTAACRRGGKRLSGAR